MTDSHGRLPRAWFTPCGHDDFWARVGTYDLIPYDALPALNPDLQDQTFSWLPERPSDDWPLRFEQFEGDVAEVLVKLQRDASAIGVDLPEAFLAFMSNPEIHTRIPTNTACYLDLSSRLIDVEGSSDAKLLRFMNDQQCVLIWYLYLTADHSISVVLADPEWRDEAPGDSLDDIITPTNLTICADSFEEFVYRFWLENTIWFGLVENRVLSESQEAYRRAAASWTPHG